MALVVDEVRDSTGMDVSVLWSRPGDFAEDVPGPWKDDAGPPAGATTFEELLDAVEDGTATGRDGWVDPRPDDLALLTYTSGTTGPSKGAMSTHTNLVYQAVVSREWFGLGADDKLLTTAPFLHITGLGLHLATGLGGGIPMVLTYRFEPATVLGLMERYRPTFTVGAITAYIALAGRAEPGAAAMSAMGNAFSGGAPVAQSVVDRYERDFGVYVHNIYGLTESTSACIGTGYWNRPDETANAFRPLGLHTGDVGVMDEQGWVFLVDRKKDLLVVSGYKVWPREVEDVLYLHPAVREAAVVGRPDEHQGESVQAFVALRSGQSATAEELREHCRKNLSAYKCPRTIEFLDDLPETATGKILRRELKET